MIDDEAKARETLAKAGVHFFKFSASDSSSYISAVYDAQWARYIQKNPQDAPKFQPVLVKK